MQNIGYAVAELQQTPFVIAVDKNKSAHFFLATGNFVRLTQGNFITVFGFMLSVCGFLQGTKYPQHLFGSFPLYSFLKSFPVKCEEAIRKISKQYSFEELRFVGTGNSSLKISRRLVTLFNRNCSTIISDDKDLGVVAETDKLARMGCPEATKKFIKVLMSEQFMAELVGKPFLTAFYDNSDVGDTRVKVEYRPDCYRTDFQVTYSQKIPPKDRQRKQASQFLLHFRFKCNCGALLGVESERLEYWSALFHIDGIQTVYAWNGDSSFGDDFEKAFPLKEPFSVIFERNLDI